MLAARFHWLVFGLSGLLAGPKLFFCPMTTTIEA
jgi:hypothetical protein